MESLHKMDPIEKMEIVIKESWNIFKCKFMNERFNVTKEAPFQHHLANIIKSVGDLYCFSRTEMFLVDLETKIDNIKQKTKFVDITCYFYKDGKVTSKGAIELKFKKKSQGADDFARIDSYVDIEALEKCLDYGFNVAYFGMITDNSIYTRKSAERTTGEIFSMRNGYTAPVNTPISNPNCKGRSEVVVTLKYPHEFTWNSIDMHNYLLLPVHKHSLK